MRLKLQQLTQETQNSILTRNIDITRLQTQIEDLKAESLRLSVEREELDSHTKEKSRESGQVIMSIKNIYTRCCLSLSRKPKDFVESEEWTFFDYLSECLHEIRDRFGKLSTLL